MLNRVMVQRVGGEFDESTVLLSPHGNWQKLNGAKCSTTAI